MHEGKIILVSGATSGIGRCIAEHLANEGATLKLIGRDPARMDEVLSSLKGTGHSGYLIDLLNISDELVELEEIFADGAALNGFVYSAGVLELLPIKSLKPSALQRTFQVNVYAFMLLVKAVTKRNRMQSGGSIIGLSSVASHCGEVANSLYASSKGALESFCRSVAMEVAPKNIRCNSISPGLVQTEMNEAFLKKVSDEQFQHIVNKHPLGLGEPVDVANVVSFLLSDKARWITGTSLIVDGGYSAQ